MPPSGWDLISIKSRFSPLTISVSFPRTVPGKCLRPSCPGSPCPTLLWYLPAFPQMEGSCPLCYQTEGILHRPLALKLLSLSTTSFLTRDPGSRPLLSKSGSDIVHTPHPSRHWLRNIKSLIFCLQQSLLFNSPLLMVQSLFWNEKKKKKSTINSVFVFFCFFFISFS